MTNISVTQLRGQIADVINSVGIKGERVILRRNKKDIVAMIPISDLEILELIEDKLDVDEILKTMKEDEGKELISWEEIKAKHGLD